MNCGDATDLMQRFVDGDLNEAEERLLMEHLDECSGCQALFARLIRLDGELRELPKVAPPFSLVDAILPQLSATEISDRERLLLFEEPDGPAEPAAEADQAGERPRGRSSSRADRSRGRRSFGWAYGLAGVVAATVAFAVVTLSGGDSFDDRAKQAADLVPNPAESAETRSEGAAASGGSKEMSGDNAAASALSTSDQYGQTSGTENRSGSPDSSPKLPGAGGDMKNKLEIGGSPEAASGPTPFRVSERTPARTPAPSDAQNGQPQATPAPTSDPAGPDAPARTPAEDKDLAKQDQDGGAEQGFQPALDGQGKTVMDAPVPNGGQTMGIASILPAWAEEGLVSPDGSRVALLAEGRMTVRNLRTGDILYRSQLSWKAEAVVTPVQWVDDNRFQYEAAVDGKRFRYEVDLSSGTEKTVN
ncbi:zf-HC2 domain-containing protein [Paenibacillus thermoaerophilus]|uniref:Anti-sigma-W factor RsiW n=1 Tax=Paenibacillus thermoaerophilus TaxID=1215385 RepID=A0ABW2UZ86_9BACL|nr:anti-sigma factor [Paenibacillus thermoaerophilus]TMV18982.1 hypothetical protein FE781_00220 [Paenibacillus thermoaerophilus]